MRLIVNRSCIFFLPLLLIVPVSARAPGPEPTSRAVARLQQASERPWQEVWSANRLRWLVGGRLVTGSTNPVEAGGRFLALYGGVVGLGDPAHQLRLRCTKRGRRVTRLDYDQTIDGVRVVDARLVLTVDESGALRSLHSSLKSFTGAVRKIKPSVASDDAVRRVLEGLRIKSLRGPIFHERAILVRDGKPRDVWEVRVASADPLGDFVVWVDVSSGKLLGKRDVLRRLDGSGRVFDPNPVVTLRNTRLRDRADSADAVPQAAYRTVTLPDIDPSGILRGPYVDVSGRSGRAREPGLEFFYNRSDSRFEQVMAYFHIDRNRRYLESLGFHYVANFPVTVVTNANTEDQSYYSPFTKKITYGSGGVDDAEDADIVVHEYGHAIQDDQVPGYGASEEGEAMGEGFGDYWAFSNDPDGTFNREIIGDWDAVAYSTADPPYLRRVDENLRYPDDLIHQEHADGRIWSRALYDIWNSVGKTIADTLVIESHFVLAADATFFDGALAVYETDRRLYGGAHLQEIFDAFNARGLAAATLSRSWLVVVAGESVQVPVRNAVLGAPATFRWEQVAGPPAENRIVTDTTLSFTAPIVPDGSLKADLVFRLYVHQGGQVVSHNDLTVTVLHLRDVLFDRPSAPVSIPDNSAKGLSRTIPISEPGPVSAILVYFDIKHTYRGDLRVELVSPSGVTSTLHAESDEPGSGLQALLYADRSGDGSDALTSFLGLEAQGTWTLKVIDTAAADYGTLQMWALGIVTESQETLVTALRDLPQYYTAGGVIDATIQLHRSGPGPVSVVSIREWVPAGWSLERADPAPLAQDPLYWQLNPPLDWTNTVVRYRLLVPALAVGTLSFVGTIEASNPSGSTLEQEIGGDSIIEPMRTFPEITVTRDLPDRFSPGQKIQVTLTIGIPADAGPSTLTIVEQVPVSWDFLSGTPTPSYDPAGHTLTWDLQVPAPAQPQTVSYSLLVPVDESTSQIFSGEFRYPTGDIIQTRRIEGDLRIDPPGELATEMYVTRTLPRSAEPTEPVEVILETVMFGPRPTMAWIEEVVPSSWQLVSTTPSDLSYFQSGRTITWIFAQQAGVSIPTIYYTVMPPSEETGTVQFEGSIKYISGGNLVSNSIIGDATTVVAGSRGKPATLAIDLSMESRLYYEDFENTNLSEAGWIAYPGGLDSNYGPGRASLAQLDLAGSGGGRGTGLLLSVGPGEVITVVLDPARAIPVETDAILSVRVTSSGAGATIAVALAERSFDGSLGFLSRVDSNVFKDSWATLNTYFSPRTGGVVPVLQVVNLAGSDVVTVSFDDLAIYSVQVTREE